MFAPQDVDALPDLRSSLDGETGFACEIDRSKQQNVARSADMPRVLRNLLMKCGSF